MSGAADALADALADGEAGGGVADDLVAGHAGEDVSHAAAGDGHVGEAHAAGPGP